MFHRHQSASDLVLVLLDGFSLLSLGALVEPFRMLTDLRPDIAPRVVLASLGGSRVAAANGTVLACDEDGIALQHRLWRATRPFAVVLCGPTDSLPPDLDPVLRLLRLAVRSGSRICGIGKVCWLMAHEGLLDGKAAAVHWLSRAAFAETHLTVEVRNGLFASEQGITTCPGESAALDLALDFLQQHFPDLVAEIANRLLVSAVRGSATPQPGAQRSRLRDVPISVSTAARIMADSIEAPQRLPVIAAQCGLSSRQLERSFRRHLGMSPVRYYADLRLERAHELTTLTGMTMTEVAVATGFSSVANLSKRFREKYGFTPTQLRCRAKPVSEDGRSRSKADSSGSVSSVAIL